MPLFLHKKVFRAKTIGCSYCLGVVGHNFDGLALCPPFGQGVLYRNYSWLIGRGKQWQGNHK